MRISTLRKRWRKQLVDFAWGQWSQLGVFAPTEREDVWAVDPEALLLFTFEVGRNDPRLFDEVLDWLLLNDRMISVQRLRNLCADEEDRDLVEAALGWVTSWQPRKRSSASRRTDDTRPLYRLLARPVTNPDPAFLDAGFSKPKTDPSRKSRPPDVTKPAAFAIRMRMLFGVGTRAEILRYLLSAPTVDVDAQLIAEAAGFAKRNINETLGALVATGTVTSYEVGNERRYRAALSGWQELLGLREPAWPRKRDWPQLLRAVRLLARRIESPELDDLTPYMLASRARDIVDEIEADLRFSGVNLPGTAAPGEAYLDDFEQIVDDVIAGLTNWWG